MPFCGNTMSHRWVIISRTSFLQDLNSAKRTFCHKTWNRATSELFCSPPVNFNRYRQKRPKVVASIFLLGLSHTRRPDASEKREENSVTTFGRFRLWISFESSHVSVNFAKDCLKNSQSEIQEHRGIRHANFDPRNP